MQQQLGDFRGLVNLLNPHFGNTNMGGIVWPPPMQQNPPPLVQQSMQMQIPQPILPHIHGDLLGGSPPSINDNA